MNPFNYQGPVKPEDLIDRREELFALQKAAANRVNTRISAPRRYGKTSLIEAHLQEMREAGHHALRVDFYRVATVADVAKRLLMAYEAGLPGARSLLVSIRKGFGLTVGSSGVSASISREWENIRLPADAARALILQLLDLPAKSYRRDGTFSVVCFDEFQDLLIADDKIDGLFRSVIQMHSEEAAYIFAGSDPSLMRELFSAYERPFYSQARPLELPRLPFGETFEELERIFRDHGQQAPPEELEAIVLFAAGHPQRTMLLAHHLFECFDEKEPDPAKAAVDRAIRDADAAFATIWENLSRPEKAVVVAIADGLRPTGSRTSAEHATPRSTLQAAFEKLVSDQRHVIKEGHQVELLDPLFAEWLRRR